MALHRLVEYVSKQDSHQTFLMSTAVLASIGFLSLLWKAFNPGNPLNMVPGPFLARLTDLPLIYHAYMGDEAQYVHKLHQSYGPTVRIGPVSVDFSEYEALRGIYLNRGGFAKARYYRNFDIDGHASIFSQPNPAERGARAKPILPLFSTASVNTASPVFKASMGRFLTRLENAKLQSGNATANILDIARSMSLDATTEYLFHVRYGALDDEVGKEKSGPRNDFTLSASAVVDAFISTSRFWYLPSTLYNWAEQLEQLVHPNPYIDTSTRALDEYSDRVMSLAQHEFAVLGTSKATDNPMGVSYPVRLLRAGFTAEETRAQCKDIIFAATDTIGMNLSRICFCLAKYPACYEKLYQEVSNADITKDEQIQQLPYLNCVIREALRLAMTNPSRFPREVPADGWIYKGITYPPGSVVSCSQYTMHFSEDIYPDAHSFRPDRWVQPSDKATQCIMAFGLGNRQCIAKGLSMMELSQITYQIVKRDLLRHARPVKDEIKILEGFSAIVVGSKIEVTWE